MATYSGDGGPAVMAGMYSPAGIVSDSAGNIYFADRSNNRIRKVGTDGVITTVAGTGTAGYTGDSGIKVFRNGTAKIFKGVLATDSALNAPGGVAVDASGNIYIADTSNNRIRKVDTDGYIITITGDGTVGYSGDGGPAEAAQINQPQGVAVDSLGNVYIADTDNNRVRKVDTAGVITTVAGSGTAGYSGDGGSALSARLNRPVDLALDITGNIYIADAYNYSVRKLSPSGIITTVAGTGSPGCAIDGAQAVSSSLDYPAGVAADSAGNIYIADYYNHCVRKVDTSGIITTFAGGSAAGCSGFGGPATAAQLDSPTGVAADPSGDLFITDSVNNCITMVEGPAYNLPVSTLLSPQTGDTIASGGYTVTGKASAANGVAFVEVSTDGGSTWGTASGGESFSYSWNPPALGTYILLSKSTDSMGRPEKIMSYAEVAVSSTAVPISVDSLNPSLSSATAGDTVTWTAAASGGTGSLLYRFLRSGPDTSGLYVTARDWASSSVWSWVTGASMAGINSVMVEVKNSDGSGDVASRVSSSYTVNYSEIVVNLIQADTPSPASAGDSVTWTVSASGGDGSLQYQFSRSGPDTGGTDVVTRDWNTSNSWTWATDASMVGDSMITVNVRNSDGSGRVSRTISYTVVQIVASIVIGSLNPSLPAATVGDTVVWTVSASGGTGSLEYQFSRSGPDAGGTYVVTRPFGTSSTWSWTTTAAMAGSNTIKVDVQNSDGTGLVSSTASYTLAPLAGSGLAGYWKFDAASGTSAADSSGLGNPGTLSGASRVGGVSGNAVSLDGAGAYVQVPGTASLKPASAVSVMAWVNTTTTPARGGEVVSMGDNYVLRVLSDGNVLFFIHNGTAWVTVQTAGVNVKDGQWHHLAGVKSASQLQVYVDGALKSVFGSTDTIPYTLGADLYIGKHGNGSSLDNFSGAIDEVRVYGRSLSTSEVQAVYASNLPPVISVPITIDSLSPGISTATAGDAVTWTVSASGGDGNLQYQFVRSGPDTGGTYVVARDWNTSSSWTWATDASMAGDSMITVNVANSDGSGQVSDTVSYTLAQPVVPIVIGLLNPSPASANAGDPVVWTVSASGGAGSLEYQFSRSGPDTGGVYVVTRPFGTSNTWSWTTTAAMEGNNTIKVDVRNSDGTGLVSSTASYALSSPDGLGLVGYWKFDAASGTSAADSSGLGNSGTLSGASRVGGVSGNAVSLDGAGSYVQVTGTASLKPASGVSVMAWVNTTTTPARGGEVVSMGDNYAMRVLSDGNVLFFIHNGTAWVTVQTAGVNVKDGQWHHLAGVKSATQLQIYVDGMLKAVYNTADTIPYTLGTDLFIGKHGNGSSLDDFSGAIDEVRVYNRDLTAPELQAIEAAITPPVTVMPITIGSLSPSPAYATSGDTVNWTVSASGGTGRLQYQFSRLGPDTGGTYVVTRAFGTSGSWTWTTTTAMEGNNTIKVDVRNSDGTGQVSGKALYTLSALSQTGAYYYVSSTGSDSNSGTINSPWKTIRYASSRLSPGDTLYVRGGTYTGEGSGSSLPVRSGTSTAPITIKAFPGETPVFDGGLSIQYVMVFSNVGWVVVDGLTIQRYSYGGMYIYSGANNITVQNCIFRNIGTNANQHHGVYIAAPDVANITVRNNLFQNNAGAGIHAWHGPNANGVLIYNNVITGGQWGIILGDGCQNIEIYNNTIDSTDYGIDFGLAGQNVTTGVTNVTMKNNIISNSTYYGMRVGSFNVNDVSGDYNLWYNNRVDVNWNGSNWTLSQYKANTANDQHSVGTNPSYANPGAGDYHLGYGSTAIDKGTPVGKVPVDKDYVSRPSGFGYDIGAYEYR